MADTPSSNSTSNESLIVRQLSQLWTLVIVSLLINAVMFTLIVIGAIIHHHQMRDGMAGGPGGPGGPGWGPPPGGRQMAWMDRGGRGGPRDFRGGFRGRDFGPGGPGGPSPGGMRGDRGMGPKDGPPSSQQVLDDLTRQLSLTDDEKAKIKPILDTQFADVQKQQDTLRASVQKQLADTRAKVKSMLTPDQQKQLDAIPGPGK